MQQMLINVLDDNSEYINSLQHINILEIGTGFGNGTTKHLYDYFENKSFTINSYEGVDECFIHASKLWHDYENVHIHNLFFCNKGDILKMILPNLRDDLTPGSPLTKKHYGKDYLNTRMKDNFVSLIDFTPDIILIDSWRFSHGAIVNKCKEFVKPSTLFIVEEDFPHLTTPTGSGKGPPFYPNGGEQDIIQKYFDIYNIKYYDSHWGDVFNFFTFNIK